MDSRYEVELKLSSARNLKNVNWRHGPNKPYAVVWVDPSNRCSTRVDESGDTDANWDQTLVIPLPTSRDYAAAGGYGYGYPYAAPPPMQGSYYSSAMGYPYGGGYNAPLQTASYGQGGGYGYAAAPVEKKKKKGKFGGMGTGLAVGALAGAVGGIALVDGAEYVEDRIADDVAERVEDDLCYDYGDYDGGDF